MNGLILKCVGGLYTVLCENGETAACRARGIFRKDGFSPTAGDGAELSFQEGEYVIETVLPRKNHMIRPYVANIDRLLLIFSSAEPDFNTLLLDKMLAVAEFMHIPSAVVVTKNDLLDGMEYAEAYREIGYPCACVCAADGGEMEEVRPFLVPGVNLLCGNSGVGKTTLLNSLAGLSRNTAEISKKLGRGRHTTREIELCDVGNGIFIGDSPGFSSLNFEAMRLGMEPPDLKRCFIEFQALSENCRFDDCTHRNEPGCAVLSGIRAGTVRRWRHASYLAFFNELSMIKKY